MMSFDKFLDKVERGYTDLDKLLAQYLAKSPTPISCHTCPHDKPGCCYQKCIADFYEALPIARHLIAQGLDTPELRERLRIEGEEMEGTPREQWFHSARPCVFLSEGRCSIYRLRPFYCRTYYVVSDPACCQPGSYEQIAFVNVAPAHEKQAIRALQIHKALELKETDFRRLLGALPRMVLLALQCWDSPDFRNLVRRQVWPTTESLGNLDWVEGRNPFGERLYQIRRNQGST